MAHIARLCLDKLIVYVLYNTAILFNDVGMVTEMNATVANHLEQCVSGRKQN